MPNFKPNDEKPQSQNASKEVIYKWKEGTSVRNYAESAQKWTEHTGSINFVQKFKDLVYDLESSNEDRAAAV